MKPIFLILLTIAFFSFKNDPITFCDTKYVKTSQRVYLKDENITAVRIVIKTKSNKFLLGYFKSAVRNDTNFIYSKLSFKGSKFFITDHFRFGIRRHMDSTVRVFSCKSKKIFFERTIEFKNNNRKIIEINKYIN